MMKNNYTIEYYDYYKLINESNFISELKLHLLAPNSFNHNRVNGALRFCDDFQEKSLFFL